MYCLWFAIDKYCPFMMTYLCVFREQFMQLLVNIFGGPLLEGSISFHSHLSVTLGSGLTQPDLKSWWACWVWLWSWPSSHLETLLITRLSISQGIGHTNDIIYCPQLYNQTESFDKFELIDWLIPIGKPVWFFLNLFYLDMRWSILLKAQCFKQNGKIPFF